MRRRWLREGVSNIVAAVFLIAIVLAVTGFLYATFQGLSDAVSSVTAQLAAINRAGRVSLTATSITVTSSSISLSLVNQGSSDVILTRYYVREYATNERWEGTLSELVPAGGTASVSIPGSFNSSASYLIVLISRDGGVYRFRYPLPTTPGGGGATGGYSLLYAPSILSAYTVAAKGYNSSLSSPVRYSDYSVASGTLTATSPPTVRAELRTLYEFPDYADWEYYKVINITENTGTDLVNYTVKIVLDNTNFDFASANPDGSDIRFLAPDKVTPLNYWIQEWDPAAGHAIIWVKVPLLRGGETTTIYMLYGNPAAAIDTAHHGLLKVMEPLPANDGSNYVIYYEPWDMGANYFDPDQGVYQSGWRADDGYWTYTLPFAFPYYATTYSSVRVCSNGFLGTTYAGADYTSTIAELGARGMIAPFWADLRTDLAGTGIYLNDSYSDEYGQGVLIRWATRFYPSNGAQNFDVVLYSNGLIRFDYGTIYGTSSTDSSPVIGISYGDSTHYTLLVTTDYESPSNWDNHNSVMLWPRKKASTEPTVSIYPAGSSGYSNAVQAYVSSLILYWRGYAPTTVVNYSVTLYIDGPTTTYTVTVQAGVGGTWLLLNRSLTGPGLTIVEGATNTYFPNEPVALMVNVSSGSQFSAEYRDAVITMRVLGTPLLAVATNLSSTVYVLNVVSGNWFSVPLPGRLVNPAIAFDYGRAVFVIINYSSTITYDPFTGDVTAGVALPAPAGDSAQAVIIDQYLIYAPGGGSRDVYVIRTYDGAAVATLSSPSPIGGYSCSADDQSTRRAYIYVGGSGELLVIDPVAGTLTQLPMSPAPPTAYPVGMDYGGGYLWVIGRGGGIHYIDPSTGSVSAAATQLPYYPMSGGDRLAYYVVSGTAYLYHVREDGTSEVWVIAVS